MKNLQLYLNTYDKENLTSPLSTAANSLTNQSSVATPGHAKYFSTQITPSEKLMQDNFELNSQVKKLQKIQEKLIRDKEREV